MKLQSINATFPPFTSQRARRRPNAQAQIITSQSSQVPYPIQTQINYVYIKDELYM